ncbi:MAG: NAD-binding protein [Acidimicrobiia bacterium]|nr:NAD-binding protein [Acidimicrobiia bacterium]MDH4307388.1 NAD-binding protein [Acidimicrobiia bacterium]MDH5293608.1 NAD-binding protein [Acidimicrobiia bacterium]MDH5522109.1 NAD-binding protein [Acidimicrobiia bacterium]
MRRVLIVGAGKAGLAIASKAHDDGYAVSIVEAREEHVTEARNRLRGVTVVMGSGTEADDLETAGIRNAETVLAVTGSDEVNLVIATLAKFHFGSPHVAARVADPRNRWLFKPDMGVDAAIDDTRLMVVEAVRLLAGHL